MALRPPCSSDDDAPYRAAWLRFTPFLVHAPALSRRQWHVLGLIATASLFDRYDLALFSLTLKHIQLGLDIAEEDLGALGAGVRLGALPAVLLMFAADRLGRRALLLVTILGYTLLTGATAVVPDVQTFVLVQFCARIFITAELLLATVVIAEEFGPAVRGWGIGATNALAAAGYALAWGLFALVNVLPFGWRALYLAGLVPLVLLAFMRRGLAETTAFVQQQAPLSPRSRPATRLRSLLRAYPRRLCAVGVVAFCMGFAESPALFFDPKYLQEAHQWSPWQVALLGGCGGGIALLGYTWAGWLGDRWGRRRTTVCFLTVLPWCIIAFYHVTGVLVPLLWIVMVFTLLGAQVSIATYGVELFPTSYRATATGIRGVLATLGGVAGLVTEGVVYRLLGSHWSAISLLALVLWVAPVVVALALPETRGQALDDIAPER